MRTTPSANACNGPLLIAGPAEDPSLQALDAAARRLGVAVTSVRPTAVSEPRVAWRLGHGLIVDDWPVDAAAAIVRQDADTLAGAEPAMQARAEAWRLSISAWALAADGVATFNRRAGEGARNPAYVLARAAALGLDTPRTLVANGRSVIEGFGPQDDLDAMPPHAAGVRAPAAAALAGVPWRDDAAPAPAIVQERLSEPSFRVFRIGRRWMIFLVQPAPAEDAAPQANGIAVTPGGWLGTATLDRLGALADDLGLDFCAFGLKSRPGQTDLCLLEADADPAFAAFDAASGGALAEAMITELLDAAAPTTRVMAPPCPQERSQVADWL